MTNRKIMKLLLAILFAFVFLNDSVSQTGKGKDDFWMEVNTNNEWFHHPVGRSLDTVYAASEHGVFRSVDSCLTWQCIGLEDKFINVLYLSDDGELYACPASNSPLYRWNGTSWDWMNYSSFSVPRAFIKTSDNALFIGDEQGIHVSVDDGNTWSYSWHNPDEGVTVANGFIELGNGILFACLTNACDYQRGVLRSTDHGNSWEHVGLYDNYWISFAKNSEGVVYAGCAGYNGSEDVGVFRTVDNGDTWEKLNDEYFVYSIAIDDNDRVYIANGGFEGLLRSSDGGYHFDNISSGMESTQSGLSLLPDGYLLSYEYESVYFGKMYRSRQSVYTTVQLPETAESQVKVWPNPATDIVHIDGCNGNETVFVYDIVGRCVLSTRLNLSQIEISELKKGFYCIQIDGINCKVRILKI